jgi:hypothetical protein
MATRRPLVLVAGVLQELVDADSLLIGLEQNTSKNVDATATLTTKTLTTRRTILTGTAGASMAFTLPAATATIDGMLITVMSINARSTVTWLSTGATFTGAPTSLTANTAVSFQYHHALTRWFISN